jgi:hypothetical protein
MFKRLLKTCTALCFVATVSAAAFAGSISVSSPSNGSTVGSPMHVVASAYSSAPVTSMRVYVDGVSQYLVYSNHTDAYINASAGSHSVIVQAWDSTGAVFKAPLTVNVAGSTSVPTSTSAPSGAKTFTTIEQMGGWESCDSCSGANATGPKIPYSMTQNVSNPSMDGRAAGFWVGGSAKYGSAIWWKQLGANSNVSHFVYDLYFYIKNTQAPFALEFDTNQTTGGKRYVMGTQCGMNYDHQWDVWDSANRHWVATGIPCTNVQAYKWNHLTEEYYRANGKIYYVSITLNGQKYYVNRNFWAIGINANDINVAFQMDLNGGPTAYNAWLDQVKLSYW